MGFALGARTKRREGEGEKRKLTEQVLKLAQKRKKKSQMAWRDGIPTAAWLKAIEYTSLPVRTNP